MSIKKILIWLPAIVMAMIIFGFSKQDGEESSGLSYKAADIILTVCDKAGIIECNEHNRESMIEAVQFPIRKAAHMTEYAILAFLLYKTFIHKQNPLIKSFIFTALYACSDEFHQLFISGRAGQIRDVCIDSTGALIMLLIIYFILKRKDKKIGS